MSEKFFIPENNGPMQDLSPIVEFFEKESAVYFAYLFGSQATGKSGPLSDLDIAVYLDRRTDRWKYRLTLMEKLSKLLKRDDVDVVVLNDAPPLLAHEVTRCGTVLKDDRAKRIPFEVGVMRAYLDTAHLRQIHRKALPEQFRKGISFGPQRSNSRPD